MSNVKALVESGILELYVMGIASPAEMQEVEALIAASPEIRKEIDEISKAMEQYAEAHAVEPHELVKPLLLATIDYTARLTAGEPMTFPPLLHKDSHIDDFREWIDRTDMVLPADADQLYARLIGHTPEATTAIAWFKEGTPFEIHDHEHERFLIIEGTCDFKIGDTVHHLRAGDYLEIPLHIGHEAKVTSNIPCKVILQRVAA